MVAQGDCVMAASSSELPSLSPWRMLSPTGCGATGTCGLAAEEYENTVSEGSKTVRGSVQQRLQTSTEHSSIEEPPQKDKKKGFRKAPELLKFTLADFPTPKLLVRCCALCGDCFTRFCRNLAITPEEACPGCSWHSNWEKDSNSDNELDIFAEYDEFETMAEEWMEKWCRDSKFSTGSSRSKQKNKVSRPKKAVREKQFRFKDFLRGSDGEPLIKVLVNQDIAARNAARKERLADAFAAKKENIEKKLKAEKRERRGPPKNYEPVPLDQSVQQRQPPRPAKYELRENSISHFATSKEEEQLLRVLTLIQHRDLLPEDYDLLLRLDEKLSKKTVESNRLRSLRTKLLTDEDVKDILKSDFAGATCTICMECYHADEVVKWLPCEHVFHSNCITTWLSEAGSICPLDGLEV